VNSRTVFACLFAALAASTSHPARAGALQVSPVGLDLPAGHAAAVLTIHNDDDEPMNVQIRVFHWAQANDDDRYDPADDVVASPPIAPLAPHTERLIRIVRTAAPATTEQSYRLIVDELPPPPGLADRRVQLLLRHSIPLFFGADAETTARVAWSVAASPQGLVVTGRNTGGRHIRIANLVLLDASGATIAGRPGLVGYILAGSEIRWTLPAASKPDAVAVRLRADGDAGAIDAALSPTP
jgi:fimbrial chaperone protein